MVVRSKRQGEDRGRIASVQLVTSRYSSAVGEGLLSSSHARCSLGKPRTQATSVLASTQVAPLMATLASDRHNQPMQAATERTTNSLGYWREPLPRCVADGKLEWIRPGKFGLQVWVATLGGKVVGRISRQPGHAKGCSAVLNGWMWTSHLEGTAAKLLDLGEQPTRGFLSVHEAKRAIEAALKLQQPATGS